MRGEDDAIFWQARVFEDFRRVAMGKKIIGLEIFVDLDEVEIATGIFAGAASSGLAIADHTAAAGDEAGFGERAESENDAGGVTAGIGDEARGGDLASVQLGEAVDGFAEPTRVRSRELIPGRKGIGGTKTESAAEIDDAQTGLEKRRGDFRGNVMRRGEKGGACVAGDDFRHGKRAERRFADAAELRKQFGEALLALRFADVEDRRFDRGMAQKNARQLETGVAGDTYYGELFLVSHFKGDD